jgi:hypothetical protein
MNFEDAAPKFPKLPKTWAPRRPQPSWDRDFTGSADIMTQAEAGTDKMKTHITEAVAFSEIIMHGMTESERIGMSRAARAEISKAARKNGK